jgi:hypothetical protein
VRSLDATQFLPEHTITLQWWKEIAPQRFTTNASCQAAASTIAAMEGVVPLWGSRRDLTMSTDKSGRRMTLRQLVTHTEKCSRDLVEHLQTTLLAQVSDFRDLSRPVRRRSHYPTLVALQNALKKVAAAREQAQNLTNYLCEQMNAIREHAQRERTRRM